jgi:hypothetical protein
VREDEQHVLDGNEGDLEDAGQDRREDAVDEGNAYDDLNVEQVVPEHRDGQPQGYGQREQPERGNPEKVVQKTGLPRRRQQGSRQVH